MLPSATEDQYYWLLLDGPAPTRGSDPTDHVGAYTIDKTGKTAVWAAGGQITLRSFDDGTDVPAEITDLDCVVNLIQATDPSDPDTYSYVPGASGTWIQWFKSGLSRDNTTSPIPGDVDAYLTDNLLHGTSPIAIPTGTFGPGVSVALHVSCNYFDAEDSYDGILRQFYITGEHKGSVIG